jgi:hypothetical protein
MEFHLTGATVDFVAGAMYYSKDAKYHEMTLQNWHPNSGLDVSLFNKTHSESSVNETPAPRQGRALLTASLFTIEC